jgi:GTP cyclohydrolase I
MQDAYRQIIQAIGEDPLRPGLNKTPDRAAKAMHFLTHGYRLNIEEVINGALFPSTANEMVIVKNIEIYSLCEHHLLPFFGQCHIGYIPNGYVIGVSKIPRIVDVFARRLQIQENLTMQIAETILKYTGALGVGVIIEAQHLCMMMRGVEKQNSRMSSSCMLGEMKTSQSCRNEFLNLISR